MVESELTPKFAPFFGMVCVPLSYVDDIWTDKLRRPEFHLL